MGDEDEDQLRALLLSEMQKKKDKELNKDLKSTIGIIDGEDTPINNCFENDKPAVRKMEISDTFNLDKENSVLSISNDNSLLENMKKPIFDFKDQNKTVKVACNDSPAQKIFPT